MRKIALLAVVAALGVVAALAAGGAGAARRAADQGFAGGGFVVNPALPGDKRVRFAFAVRESQTTGVVPGKTLTYRVQGFDSVRYVVRGASFGNCSLVSTPGGFDGGASVTGRATLSTVDPFTSVETVVDTDVGFRVGPDFC